MSNTGYILWLPSWYPNELQPFNGDFVQRHAQATSLYCDIEVIHVVKDVHGTLTKSVRKTERHSGRLKETIIYYHSAAVGVAVFSKLLSHRRFIQLLKQEIRQVIATRGKPQLAHVYIALKHGMVAGWLQEQYGVPYIVSEQSTVYLEEAKPNFHSLNVVFKHQAKKIFREAQSVMTVSQYLGNALAKKFGVSSLVIPNVVNDQIFNFRQHPENSVPVFVHISNLNYQKAADKMLQAFAIVKEQGFSCRLNIVGPDEPLIRKMIDDLQLNDIVALHHEMPQKELVKLVQSADAMIFCSRYETFGCVMIEAFACGVPVILSDIPVFHENADKTNAIFASPDSEDALATAIIQFMSERRQFERKNISSDAIEKYNYRRVGAMIFNWYNRVLQKKSAS